MPKAIYCLYCKKEGRKIKMKPMKITLIVKHVSLNWYECPRCGHCSPIKEKKK